MGRTLPWRHYQGIIGCTPTNVGPLWDPLTPDLPWFPSHLCSGLSCPVRKTWPFGAPFLFWPSFLQDGFPKNGGGDDSRDICRKQQQQQHLSGVRYSENIWAVKIWQFWKVFVGHIFAWDDVDLCACHFAFPDVMFFSRYGFNFTTKHSQPEMSESIGTLWQCLGLAGLEWQTLFCTWSGFLQVRQNRCGCLMA